ncbi:hypothetical protein FCV53_04810 [Vibrio sp. F12]|nr:hypothetical protein FCV53_04810 [Vibrio sp. F12]
MNSTDLERYNTLYEQHLTNLKLQGKRPATIDAYARTVRRISHYFDCCPDSLTTEQLKQYFANFIQTHSWSTIKLDRDSRKASNNKDNGRHQQAKEKQPLRTHISQLTY